MGWRHGDHSSHKFNKERWEGIGLSFNVNFILQKGLETGHVNGPSLFPAPSPLYSEFHTFVSSQRLHFTPSTVAFSLCHCPLSPYLNISIDIPIFFKISHLKKENNPKPSLGFSFKYNSSSLFSFI